MKQKIGSLLVIIALAFPQTPLVLAQVSDATLTDPTSEPAPTTDTAPVEETVVPPADTTGPVFISVATASAQETEVNVVWTTDELAYGYVEYGETTSYGLSTPKSDAAAMDHAASITGLTPGTAYHYRVVAEDESGNVSYSKDRTFETDLEVVAIDNVPPKITDISVTNITASEATISWMTDELAQGKVEYGNSAEYGASSPLTPDYVAEHSVSLSGLDPDTAYHYRVVVQDESGNEAVSPDEIFATNPSPATTPTEEPAPTPDDTSTATDFSISQVETASVGTTTARIIWKTTVPASAQVFYGPDETYAFSSPLSATGATSHEIRLTGLKAGTNYFYKVVSRNDSGRTVEKSGFEFNTLYEQKVVVPPTISGVSVQSIGQSTAVIVFNTDLQAGGKINYGTTTGYEETDGGHDEFLTNHSHPLSNLEPDTLYNFEIVVWDALGNETIYENLTFSTLKAETAEKPAAGSPAPARAPSFGGSGSYSSSRRVVGKPVITKVDPLDSQTLFIWQAAKPESGLKTVIVRSENSYALTPDQGMVVYRGNSGRFADINLQNGRRYYYSTFRMNEAGAYSTPLRFTVVPKQEKTQTKIIATPPVVQRTPIYTFSRTLSRGDENKQVEHLQVLLASESSIYRRGLITGYFGPLTETAVRNFQKRYDIPVTGIADNATLKKLERLSSIGVVKDKAKVFDDALSRDLKVGHMGGDVSVLQQFLVNAEVYPEALITGYFGPLTESAVQRFQREQNITPALGYFGPITKKRVLNLIRLRSVSF